MLFEQIVILIVIARDGFDDGLKLSHILAHAQRETQPRLLGQGGGFQPVQIVIDGQPPLLQLVAIEGEPVAQLLQRSGDGAEGGACARLRQFQQLGAVEDFVHQPADLVGQEPFQILLHLQRIHAGGKRHALLPGGVFAVHGRKRAGGLDFAC